MQQDNLNLEETCVMVTGDELKLVPKVGDSSKTNEVHTLVPKIPPLFSTYTIMSNRNTLPFKRNRGGESFRWRRSLQESKNMKSLQHGMGTVKN